MSKTATFLNPSYDEHHFLPRLGFGSDVNFDTIAGYHRYLFRIYTPKSLPAIHDDTVYFVAPRFDHTFAPRTPTVTEMYDFSSSCEPLVDVATYEDCIKHLSWETRSTSPFISASFSLFWVIWDALRRYNIGVKHDVEIAVIDAGSLSGKAVTALQLLRKSPSSPSKRHARHWRWCRFAQDSQLVLVHGFIPRSAVLASVPLRVIVQNLPSYFLKAPFSFQNGCLPSNLPLPQILAWDCTSKKGTSFQKFCQESSDRFTRLPYQSRVREIAIASVRLALTMLNAWFHQTVERGDMQSAVTRIRDLSALIAHWPEQPGSRDYAEMTSLMKALIQLLAEEVRGSNIRARQATEEVLHLQKMVDSLLEAVRFRGLSDESESQDKSTSLSPHSTSEYPRPGLKITIPDSTPSSSSCPSSASPLTPHSEGLFASPSPSKSQLFFTPRNPPSPDFSSSSAPENSRPPSPLILTQSERPPSPPLRISLPSKLPSPGALSSSPPSLYYSALKSPQFEFPLVKSEGTETSELRTSFGDFELVEYFAEENWEEDDTASTASTANTLQDAVSYAVTGFLIGTLITLCILSSQRRTLLYVT
ncbi:hypothetical protein GYMLUDRAFT_53907 [Collybiopsis luxurians FD-317 M1]|nr:hypothetical protein GYMLUDRAFT_53907 [Collybiopsis luxurians FD-317 M1]